MSVTWREITLITLQKMFAADGANIPKDAATTDYLASMPGAANEGLQLLATAGKFIIKSIDIAHNPIPNLLTNGAHIFSSLGEDLEFVVGSGKSLFFEYNSNGEVGMEITYGEASITDTLPGSLGYTPMRYLISNPDGLELKIKFSSLFPFAIKNIAIYAATFPNRDDVPTFADKVRYNLKELAPDFYALSTEDIYYEGDANVTRYIRTTDYFQEGNTVLVLDRNMPGNFRVYYKAYPTKIEQTITDDTELAIDNEVVPLLCLYMASELYKDDDNAIATVYRNEFEVGFERLLKRVKTPSAERFVSESGWI